MDYNYVLTIEYDKKPYLVQRIVDFTDAAQIWGMCKDSGNAEVVATYTMTDPTGKSFSKTFYSMAVQNV